MRTRSLAEALSPEAGRIEARTNLSERDSFVDAAGRNLDRVYRLAGLLLHDEAEAEDAVGEALERAWTRRSQLRDPSAFGAWFERIVINACRDRLRRRQRVRFVVLEEAFDRDRRDPFSDVFERDELARAIADLPFEQRVVVVLHYWGDLSLDEVARRAKVPPGTVRSRLNRALATLRASGELTGVGR